MLLEHKKILTLMIWLVAFVGSIQISQAKNLAVLDGNTVHQTVSKPMYTVLRTAKPSYGEFQKICRLGVRKMIVLSGNGNLEMEYARRPWSLEHCKGFQVIYNRTQKAKKPLSKQFLISFDAEIAKAKAGNYGIGFRCNCGCHRTGRLAAYFNMKYKGFSVKKAIDNLHHHMVGFGKLLHRRKLKKQIYALEDYIRGRSCGEKRKFCPTDIDDSGIAYQSEEEDPDFAVDETTEEPATPVVSTPVEVRPVPRKIVEVDELDQEDLLDGEKPYIHDGISGVDFRNDSSTYMPRYREILSELPFSGNVSEIKFQSVSPVIAPAPVRLLSPTTTTFQLR